MIAVVAPVLEGPAALVTQDLPDPSPAEGEVLIAVDAATINPVDAAVLSGSIPRTPHGGPYVLGWDLVGHVTALGEGVDASWAGARVLGFSQWFQKGQGTFAELVALPLENIARASESLDAPALTSAGLNGLTALQLVRSAVTSESMVLVTGAGGAVGEFAVRIAARAGATVIAVAATEKRDELLAAGAEQVVDRDVPDLDAAVRELVPEGVDVVLNTVPSEPQALGALKDGGLYRSVTVTPDAERGIDVARVGVHPSAADLAEVVALAEDGTLGVHAGQEYLATDARAAFESFIEKGPRPIVLTF